MMVNPTEQASRLPGLGQEGEEPLGAAAGVGTDQYPPPLVAGQLGEREPHGINVIGGRS